MRDVELRLLGSHDMDLMRSMLSMFREAFEDSETFSECSPDDAPAIALCTKHGIRKDVLHFDIVFD